MPSIRTLPVCEPVRRFSLGPWQAELLPRQPYEASYTPHAFVIGFAFEGQQGTHAFATDRVQAFRTKPNSLAFVPPDCDVFSRSSTGGEYLRLTAPGLFLQEKWAQRPFNDAIDSIALAAARDLRRFLLRDSPGEPLFFEQRIQILVDRARRFLDGGARDGRADGWMTPRRLKRIDDLIEASLDQGLTVADLSRTLELSEGFFSRAFKAAIGTSPYDYILDRRISRARSLLRQGPDDLSAVAFASGFASHAHMTAVFRSRLGLTPSALRDGSNAQIEKNRVSVTDPASASFETPPAGAPQDECNSLAKNKFSSS
jgi:AraC family transcriptional regulator